MSEFKEMLNVKIVVTIRAVYTGCISVNMMSIIVSNFRGPSPVVPSVVDVITSFVNACDVISDACDVTANVSDVISNVLDVISLWLAVELMPGNSVLVSEKFSVSSGCSVEFCICSKCDNVEDTFILMHFTLAQIPL